MSLEFPTKSVYEKPALIEETVPDNPIQPIENEKRSVDPETITEALNWHELFQKGWATAHELKNLPQGATLENEGLELKVDTEKLLALKEFLHSDCDDEEFRENLSFIESLLPTPFEEMQGEIQNQPHWDLDPTEHTLNALELLDTSELNPKDRLIARMSLIFHDVGKVLDSTSRVHAYRSEEIAQDYLVKMGFGEEDRQEMLAQIRYHDALGELTRRDGENMLDERNVLLTFPDQRQLDIHHAVARADIGSIPGLEWALPEIEETYHRMSKKMVDRDKWIEIEKLDLPFKEAESNTFFELMPQLVEEDVLFDDVHIEEDLAYRKAKFEGGTYQGKRFKQESPLNVEFEGIDRESKEKLERLIIQYSLRNDRKMLFATKLMGRETDLEYVKQLEEKYDLSLDNLRVSAYMHKMTYQLWELDNELNNITEKKTVAAEDQEEIKKKLLEIKHIAVELSRYTVETTHGTSNEDYAEIDQNRVIYASDSTEKHEFEGSGVYTGMFHSFRDWGEALFVMQTRLADTLPVILDYRFPKAMANILSEQVDLIGDREKYSFTKGLVHWQQCAYGNEEVAEWKLSLLEEALGTEVKLATDENGDKCVIADTHEDPIVWASLCRALRIRRLIPFNELKKLGLDFKDETGQELDFGNKSWTETKHYDYYLGLAQKAFRLRGISAKELEL